MGPTERKAQGIMISGDARQLIEQFPLGFVATVTSQGLPSVSPKGTFLILDDKTLAFAEIRSPQTMANLQHLRVLEVNFADIWKRKSVRVFGPADIADKGTEAFETLIPLWQAAFPSLVSRINAIVRITAERVRLITTPPYDDGATEEEMIALYRAKFREIYD